MRRNRVLVADESAEIAHLEAALFSIHGHNVDIVRDGDTALRRLATMQYDVLVLGAPVIVTEGNALRFFLDVLIERFAANLPRTIVVTAAADDRALLDRAAQAQAFAIIAKPLDVTRFSECVDQCIAGDGSLRPTRWIASVG